jgi:hypothetical protein
MVRTTGARKDPSPHAGAALVEARRRVRLNEVP